MTIKFLSSVIKMSQIYYLFDIVSVGAQTSCRSTVSCGEDDEIGIMTIEQCCLGTPNGLAFSTGEICTPCIGM